MCKRSNVDLESEFQFQIHNKSNWNIVTFRINVKSINPLIRFLKALISPLLNVYKYFIDFFSEDKWGEICVNLDRSQLNKQLEIYYSREVI